MKIEATDEVTTDLEQLWHAALKRMESHRGGPELLATIRGDVASEDLLETLVDEGAVWTIGNDEHLAGFAVVRHGVVEGLFVTPNSRRQHVATSLLNELVASGDPPRDGFALPGDRGMKSLYESFGWKARLLTMRGE
ncbi:MAG TPA: GNAT family N-acetyltransferase [Acidimicrobiales bacterium]